MKLKQKRENKKNSKGSGWEIKLIYMRIFPSLSALALNLIHGDRNKQTYGTAKLLLVLNTKSPQLKQIDRRGLNTTHKFQVYTLCITVPIGANNNNQYMRSVIYYAQDKIYARARLNRDKDISGEARYRDHIYYARRVNFSLRIGVTVA